jgi:hypothetical protein
MFWTSSSEHIPWWLSCQLNGAVNLDSRFGEGILFAVSVLFPFSFDSSACQFRLRIARDGTKKKLHLCWYATWVGWTVDVEKTH